MANQNIKQSDIERIIKAMTEDKRVRLNIVKRSHLFFFYFYFAHYIQYKIAPFQEEMFHITQDTSIRNAIIVAFRGSGKSTIFSLSFPLWAILGEQHIKHVILLSQTQQKAQMLLQQIKIELETNELLKKDLGPFREERTGWNSVSLHLVKYNAKITVASTEQSIRSTRHMQYRPQLICADDIEDLESVKTLEGRDKTYNWFFGDVVPAGDRNTRVMVIGSLLHEDLLIKRLKKSILENQMAGVYREYPILDENNNPTWPGKFPDQKTIYEERKKGYSDSAWYREFMLKIINDDSRVFYPEWIKKYSEVPAFDGYCYAATGIDLAISEKDTADYTAMVSAMIYRLKDDLKIYILPNPVNERLNFPATLRRAKAISVGLGNGGYSYLFVEKVAYQAAIINQLEDDEFPVEGVEVHGQDKRTRLALISYLVKIGRVVFPECGAEQLIGQLVGFGIEKHDDLADAFAILLIKVLEKEKRGHIVFSSGDAVFDRNKDYKLNDKKSEETNPGVQTKILKIELPWKNKEELKKLEREEDLKILRRDRWCDRLY